jgi:hypothetical protein
MIVKEVCKINGISIYSEVTNCIDLDIKSIQLKKVNKFKSKLEKKINKLYKKNKISIDGYFELMKVCDPQN